MRSPVCPPPPRRSCHVADQLRRLPRGRGGPSGCPRPDVTRRAPRASGGRGPGGGPAGSRPRWGSRAARATLLAGLLTGGPAWPEVVGFDFTDIDRAITFGTPPSNGTVLVGSFDPSAIGAAYAARGYTSSAAGEHALLCPEAGCDTGLALDLASIDPRIPFGGRLGRSEPLAVAPSDLLSSADAATIDADARGRGREHRVGGRPRRVPSRRERSAGRPDDHPGHPPARDAGPRSSADPVELGLGEDRRRRPSRSRRHGRVDGRVRGPGADVSPGSGRDHRRRDPDRAGPDRRARVPGRGRGGSGRGGRRRAARVGPVGRPGCADRRAARRSRRDLDHAAVRAAGSGRVRDRRRRAPRPARRRRADRLAAGWLPRARCTASSSNSSSSATSSGSPRTPGPPDRRRAASSSSTRSARGSGTRRRGPRSWTRHGPRSSGATASRHASSRPRRRPRRDRPSTRPCRRAPRPSWAWAATGPFGRSRPRSRDRASRSGSCPAAPETSSRASSACPPRRPRRSPRCPKRGRGRSTSARSRCGWPPADGLVCRIIWQRWVARSG